MEVTKGLQVVAVVWSIGRGNKLLHTGIESFVVWVQKSNVFISENMSPFE